MLRKQSNIPYFFDVFAIEFAGAITNRPCIHSGFVFSPLSGSQLGGDQPGQRVADEGVRIPRTMDASTSVG